MVCVACVDAIAQIMSDGSRTVYSIAAAVDVLTANDKTALHIGRCVSRASDVLCDCCVWQDYPDAPCDFAALARALKLNNRAEHLAISRMCSLYRAAMLCHTPNRRRDVR